MRGEQLGAAIGATVRPNATRRDILKADVTIVTKRVPESVLRDLRATKAPWVFDVIDCYPQPQCSTWNQGQAVAWIHKKLEWLAPTHIIWPTERMRQDCSMPGLVLKHHHRIGIKNNPIREKVAKVGYEGDPRYLEGWTDTLAAECKRRGWGLVFNPKDLADLDIVVAMRGGVWSGYVQKHYKSAVKLANAHGSGTPFIGAQESGYIESATGAEYWAHDQSGLGVCFDWLEDQGAREQIHDRFLQAAYPVEKAAADLKAWLDGL